MLAADTIDEHAIPEAEVSLERQRMTREQVIRPLQRLEEHNEFAALIRDSLIGGRRRRT